jgi:hypothetical protein
MATITVSEKTFQRLQQVLQKYDSLSWDELLYQMAQKELKNSR